MSGPALPGPRVGPEIANAWGWLLNRAPRLAKALQATPGATATVADILAGFDLFHRRHGLTRPQEMAEVERKVIYVEGTDCIVIYQTPPRRRIR
jgi:hypothetical protein